MRRNVRNVGRWESSEYCTAIVNGTASVYCARWESFILWLKIIIKLPFSLAWSSLCLSYVAMTVDVADVVTAQPLMFVA